MNERNTRDLLMFIAEHLEDAPEIFDLIFQINCRICNTSDQLVRNENDLGIVYACDGCAPLSSCFAYNTVDDVFIWRPRLKVNNETI